MLRRRRHGQGQGATEEPKRGSASRRRFLLGTAGVAGVAVADIAGARPASAFDGAPIIAGKPNGSLNETLLEMNSATGASFHGKALGNGTAGVRGTAFGHLSGGVWGVSDFGNGVTAESPGGTDLTCRGSGRLHQLPKPFAGPPRPGGTTTFKQGEQLRDMAGDLYLCVAGGNPGSWVRAATVQPDYAGGSLHLLARPVRVYDTRAGFTARTAPGAPLTEGSPREVEVGGFTYDGVTVPAAIAGVLCNLTVVDTDASGFLTAYPTGTTRPGTSNLNYRSGDTVANAATVRTGGPDAAPTITLVVGGGTAHVLVDLVGFIA